MPGKKSCLTLLEVRKELLLAESELNRARLCKEWSDLKDEVHRLTEQARTVGSIASLAGTVMTAFSARREGRSEAEGGTDKSSRVAGWLNVAQAAAALWVALKACFR